MQMARVALQQGIGVRSLYALHAVAEPERLAAVDRRRSLTYVAFNRELDALASGLVRDLGARRGLPVTIMMDNRVEYLVAWFSLSRLAITCAHASRYATAEELHPLLVRSGSRIVVVSDATRAVADEVAAAHPELRLTLVHVTDGDQSAPGEAIDYHTLVARHAGQRAPVAPRDAGSESVVYTSGTTGRPKGAVRDLKSVGVRELFQILERLPLHCGDRHLVVAPLYHSAAQVFVLLNAALTNTIIIEDKFDAPRTLQRMSEAQIHSVFMVPTMIHRLLDLPDDSFAQHPTPTLRAIVSGAALFDTALRQAAVARFGAATIFDFYGATELGWVTLIGGDEMLPRPGSVGRAIPGQEIGIFDDAGQRLPSGEIGVVYTRSTQMMRGYLGDADATQDTKLRRDETDDWATVDDLGYLDAENYLYVTGRARDMVISGGVNVYPVEIENTLVQHPAIREVAVIGLPHAEWGEVLTAVVVTEAGFDAEEATRWARTRLAPYKVPRRWDAIDVLPRNPTGKILKRELRERLASVGVDAQ